MKKSLLLLVLLLSASLAFAGGKKENGVTTGTTTPAPSEVAGNSVTKYFHKYDPKITFTVILAPGPGKSIDDPNPWGIYDGKAKWTEEVNGIIWKPVYNAPNSENQAKTSLAIASDDLPDYLRWISKEQFLQAQKNGQLMPLNELLDKYASPLVKYLFFDEYNNAYDGKGFMSATFDGQIYGLPAVMDAISSSFEQEWMRGDILADLGLETPTTITELENVLQTFKDKYPNRVGWVMTKDLMGTDAILAAYGGVRKKWIKDSSGQVVYGSVQPEIKNGLAKLAEFYAKGYIDPEFIAKDSNQALETFSQRSALILGAGAYWNPYYPFPDMAKANPSISFIPLGYITGPNGTTYGQVLDDPMAGWCAISAKTKNAEGMIYEMNRTADSYYRNHLDLREKFDFYYPVTEYRDPVNKDEVAKGANPIYDYPPELQGPIDFLPSSEGPNHDGQVGLEPELRAGFEMAVFSRISKAIGNNTFDALAPLDKNHYQYRINSMLGERTCMTAMIAQEVQRKGYFDTGLLHTNEFLGTPTPTMQTRLSYLEKLELQVFSDIIVGNVPVDKFDEFVQQWKSQGGDQITAEVNSWVESNS